MELFLFDWDDGGNMPDWLPMPLSRRWLAALGVVYVLLVAYSVLYAGSLLYGVVALLVAAASLYLLWRFLVLVRSFERVAGE